eukprot:6747150-Lingulodinium_polyedra.AAC.1
MRSNARFAASARRKRAPCSHQTLVRAWFARAWRITRVGAANCAFDRIVTRRFQTLRNNVVERA